MMRALLIDDEPHNCELIETLIHYHLPNEIEIVGHAYSVEQAEEILRLTPIDLVFLDIQMPGKNGFELLNQFDPPPFEVIFITSFDDYALPAIKTEAVDYLLKPVDIDELKRAVHKASKMRILRKMTPSNLLPPVSDTEMKIAVHEGDKVVFLNSKDIVSLQAAGRYTKISLVNGQQHIVAKNLKILEDSLENHHCFIRINRSVVLNSSCVSEYSKSDPFYVIMTDGSSFEISRRKRKEILTELKGGNHC